MAYPVGGLSGRMPSRRIEIVRAHMDAENRKNVEETLTTFARPRYEVVPTGEVHNDAASVSGFLLESFLAFPDIHLHEVALHETAAGVVAEAEFRGTHGAMWRGLPPTRKPVRYKMCNLFLFEGDDLVCERLYFDVLTAMKQIGIARDPTTLGGRLTIAMNHPITLANAVLGSLLR
mgnify:CR=1 FL=1